MGLVNEAEATANMVAYELVFELYLRNAIEVPPKAGFLQLKSELQCYKLDILGLSEVKHRVFLLKKVIFEDG